MKHRIFGPTGRRVSEVGLGCWQLGANWGAVSDADALATLYSAYERGVTFFDTADVYGDGRSERLVGEFLRETKAKAFVATKLGRRGDPGWPANFTREAMRRHTEDSLHRLGVDALDLTQLHCVPFEELRRGDVFETLRELQREGKIKAFGASVETVAEARHCLEVPGLASLQFIFNLFRQKAVAELLPAVQAKGVAFIVRLPLASGLLAGKYTAATQFPVDDHRNFNRDGQAFNVGETFAGLPFAKGVELADELRSYVPAGMAMADFALRWCLDHEAVTTIIPGARNPEQARGNLRASELTPLPPALHARLRQFYDEQVAAHIRGPY
ncbi:MAG TPA: aldo/keto reductase [Opitutaceae bacterium]|nr:aldo/keto reductase [Opitutaceae bacterium]